MIIHANRSLNNPFMALKHRNYMLYMIGMFISLIGTWMQNIAQPWLAYSITGSPFLLSLVGIMQFMPVLLFSLFAGVIIDRFPKKKIILFTQSISLVITLFLSILVWSGHVQYWHILVAATALGFVNTLDMPTRQSFVIEMVGKEDMLNAIALNSSTFNIARILGPGLAGVLMKLAGVASCFYFNSFSFAAVIISLIFIKPLTGLIAQKSNKNVMQSIKDGLRYIYRDKLLLKTMISVLIVGTFAMNFSVLVPVFSKIILKQDEAGFGFLMSFMGVGSFFGAMFIATISRQGPNKNIMKIFPAFIAIFLIFTGFTCSFLFTALGLAVTGFCFVAYSSTANSTLQFNTEDEYRGRVMSVYTLVFSGSTPIGNLYAGLVTEKVGPASGFIACGVAIILLFVLVFIWKGNSKREKSII